MKKLISEQMILDTYRRGEKVIFYSHDTIITAAARDKAVQLGIRLDSGNPPETPKKPREITTTGGEQIAIGSDHGGFLLKEALKPYIENMGYTVMDFGTFSEEACDYPDYAYAVARAVSGEQAQKGIMIDSVGLASAIVANKIPGIRAVPCYNEFSARSSREHNDANILTLGGKVMGLELAKAIVKVWLETQFSGGRHQNRLEKITDIERKLWKTVE
jgi:ribose 5-phosphate isomerase B